MSWTKLIDFAVGFLFALILFGIAQLVFRGGI